MQKQALRCWLLISCLILSIIGVTLPNSGYAEDRSFWGKRKKNLQGSEEGKEDPAKESVSVKTDKPASTIDPLSITIPSQYGSIIETHRGHNDKLIVHIQDAHINYEGQLNSAHILESLVKNYDLNLILVEGKVTDRDFKYLRPRNSLKVRKAKANELLKDGYLNSVNYLDLATDITTKNRGIEDINLYDSQRNALWEIDKFKEIAAEYVDKMIAAANAVKPHIYSEALLSLDSKKKDYEDEKMDLVTYYEYLHEKASEQNIPLYTFPNFSNLIKARELERKMNLEEDTTVNQAEVYREYRELTANLNVNDLFKEEPLLEDTVKEYLAENSDQRRLIRISKALSIISNLLKIKVVPEEYAYFRENKDDFDPKFWTTFLKGGSEQLNLSLNIPNNFYVINDNIQKIEKFYGIAFERDKMFIKRTEEHLTNENVNLAALVAGGFHTPTLIQLLQDAGYSYIVISPKVTTKTDDTRYRWALKREWLPEIKRR